MKNIAITGCPKAGKRADLGKWTRKTRKTYTFCCLEAGKAAKSYTLDIKFP